LSVDFEVCCFCTWKRRQKFSIPKSEAFIQGAFFLHFLLEGEETRPHFLFSFRFSVQMWKKNPIILGFGFKGCCCG